MSLLASPLFVFEKSYICLSSNDGKLVAFHCAILGRLLLKGARSSLESPLLSGVERPYGCGASQRMDAVSACSHWSNDRLKQSSQEPESIGRAGLV